MLLSFGVMMSCQVGGRWGSTTGVNNFVFAGFGIPFGLTFIVLCQGCELMVPRHPVLVREQGRLLEAAGARGRREGREGGEGRHTNLSVDARVCAA